LNRSPAAPLLHDFRVLLYLFVGFRLMILVVFAPVDGLSAGVTAFGDYPYYYDLAKLSDSNKLPYRDYWYEFPPIFPIISLTIYQLITPKDFPTYTLYLGILMTAVDTLNLILLRRIASRLYDDIIALSITWIYALLAVPLVFTFWTFEPLALCALLIALWCLLSNATSRSAIAIALGALTKFFPLILLIPVWRFRPPRNALRYTLIAAGVTLIGLLLMLALPFGLPSLLAQFNKASYQSLWALIDHNYRTGTFGLISDHFDPSTAYLLIGNPPVVPLWLRTLIFGLISLFIYSRTRRYDPISLIAFITLTITLFFLWSQGFSPQWLMILLPLILLNYPTRNGVLFILLLTLDCFIEYPLSFSHFATPNGLIVVDQLPRFALTVLIRTIALIVLTIVLYRRLRTP